MRVAVFGASGFVGSCLVERLWTETGVEVRSVIHSTGNAARLARFGRPMVMADLMTPNTLAQAIEGCTHIVNCSRGSTEVMTRGLENLLDAARQASVQRFVHLSSVAVYGDRNTTQVMEESATPEPARGTYGHMKLLQDRLVSKAAARGLSAIILCPPNISGPSSVYLLEILDAIRRGRFALVDGGRQSCELVDVLNLVHAIRLALTAESVDGDRVFVTDGARVTWHDVTAALLPLTESANEPPTISLEEARALATEAEALPPAFSRALRHLASSEVRQVLKRDPWFAQAEKRFKAGVRRFPRLEQMLRSRFANHAITVRPRTGVELSERLLKQQLRGVTYSQDRAQRVLGYQPIVGFEESMTRFADWHAFQFGRGDEWWPLLQELRTE